MTSQTEQTYRERILRVLVHIQTHLDEALCLEDLARLAHFSPYHFHRICHDDPEVTPPDKIRYDACIPVGNTFEATGHVGVQGIAGGEYAVYTHRGPYSQLGESYAKLCGQWLPASGREPGSTPCFEIYRNSPQNTPPDQLITDIYLPLQPRQ